MSYSAEISRANPTCFLFLIDRSKSMRDPLPTEPGRTLADAVADAINQLLYVLTLRCVKGNAVLDRFLVGVIGYGAEVGPALAGPLTGRDLVPIGELARNPLRVETRMMPGPDGSPQPTRFPVWFEPAGTGKTPMCTAIRSASTLLAGFLVDHPDSFPPVVINITDGKPTDGNPEHDATRLRTLSSTDGNVLLFNLHLSPQSSERIFFPESEDELTDPYARLLFRMSSPLPPPLADAAGEFSIRSGTPRGFVYNADLASVIQALDIGTRVSLPNRM